MAGLGLVLVAAMSAQAADLALAQKNSQGVIEITTFNAQGGVIGSHALQGTYQAAFAVGFTPTGNVIVAQPDASDIALTILDPTGKAIDNEFLDPSASGAGYDPTPPFAITVDPAGNFALGHTDQNGLAVSIYNPVGSYIGEDIADLQTFNGAFFGAAFDGTGDLDVLRRGANNAIGVISFGSNGFASAYGSLTETNGAAVNSGFAVAIGPTGDLVLARPSNGGVAIESFDPTTFAADSTVVLDQGQALPGALAIGFIPDGTAPTGGGTLPTGVPEPSAWALMVVGLGGMGAMFRRAKGLRKSAPRSWALQPR